MRKRTHADKKTQAVKDKRTRYFSAHVCTSHFLAIATMWRYIEGVQPPPIKQKTVEEKEKASKYEETRTRSFQKTWMEKFGEWLRYEDSNKLMFCTVCEKFAPRDSNFVKCCSSLQFESLKMHEASKVYARSIQAAKAAAAPPGTSGSIQHAIQQLNEEAVAKLKILFSTAHALAKHCRPFTDYKWMCALDEKKGLDIGQTYRSDVKCREFVDAIAEVERKQLETAVQQSKFLAIMCDEATDAAVMEQLIIYIR